MLGKIKDITESRISNAKYLDFHLSGISEIRIPERIVGLKEVFHIYSFIAENRDELIYFLRSFGIDAKIHYPVPMHLQPAATLLGPIQHNLAKTEFMSHRTISLPVHEFVDRSQLDFMIAKVKEFYGQE